MREVSLQARRWPWTPQTNTYMSTLKTNILVTPQELFTSTSTQGTDLGALATTGDGRYYRYFLNGAVTTVPGKIYQGPAQDTTNQSPSGGLAVAAAAIGATTVTLTGSLTLAANLLAGGFMSVNVTPGQGYQYKVKSNTAVSGAANCVVTLEDPILVALTTSSKVIFNLNQYNGCVVAPATLTAAPVGVPAYAVVNAQYGWMQTHGTATCLLTGTFASAGLAVGVLVGGTIGSLAPAIAGTNVLGYTVGISTTGEYDQVFLQIDQCYTFLGKYFHPSLLDCR